MRRFPDQSQGQNQQQNQQQEQNQQQQTIQTQQFPVQQFPPEQQGLPGQRPFMQFPHATAPVQQQPAAPQPQPNPQANVQSAPQQPQQGPYGLALQPASPPRISYTGGQLTVTANNSSLPDILGSVVRITGAQLEGSRPPESERVFGQFGPGSPRDVLNSLLSGSRYDYILVSALDDPGKVRQVMLTPHGTSLQSATASVSNEPQEEANQAQEEEENVVNVQPATEPPAPPAQVNTSPEPPPGQQQVKTTEQLLQELQRLHQQQQQQQNPH
jgi:hypothetical protein